MTKIFKVPFAAQGDRVSIPNEVQPDGAVSYTQGYGYDYERDQNVDPVARDIEREKMNGLFHDITEAVGEIQTFGTAQWNAEAQPYPLRALVYHKQKLWQSHIENNKDEPAAGNAWVELKADLTADEVGAYSKGESNQRFQPLGNYTLAGYGYSKKESDTRFQPKGNYQPAGDYATNVTVSGKLDKSAIAQSTGQNPSLVMSQKAITDALVHAVSIDSLYPIGIVVWFAQNKNPNNLFPNTIWKYIGEHRTIRLAASNGSDVLSVGGSDSIKLSVAQMPAHNHRFSGETSNFDYGTKTTNSNGNHSHTVNGMGAPGNAHPKVSTTGGGAYTFNRPSTNTEGAHTHSVVIGSHRHTFNGTTQNTGGNREVNITNSFIKLMGWYRSA
ncbi:phage tail protein [Xenorhabdus sp. TH1]|uniref:phage baseplate protein n=1 Tax=Xenorhabdus sp. TH1 TaxID=3130166 RepID=UPI0030CD77C5